MAKRIEDFRASQPRSRFNTTTATTIPRSPSRLRLQTVTIRIARRSDVKLIATVGVRGVTGIAQLRFRIFRDGREIFNAQQGVESAGSEQNYIVAFQDIDFNVSPVRHTYTLTVENRTAGTTAQVVGPVNLSALAISRRRII